jgi:hypothetical protein
MGVIGDIFETLGMPREAIEIIAGIDKIGDDTPKIKMTMRSIRYLPRLIFQSLRYLIFEKTFEQFIHR